MKTLAVRLLVLPIALLPVSPSSVAAYAKHDQPVASWHIPHGCKKG